MAAFNVLLTTLNAKYIHASFGLRYLQANLSELRPHSQLVEFDINQRPLEIAEQLLKKNPEIIGFGVYIWNTLQTEQVVRILKRLRPEITIILGGPEVSFETDEQSITAVADYVVTGEADVSFRELCRTLLAGSRPVTKIIHSPLPVFNHLELPYDLYTSKDIAHRIIYIEASRGCPFSCEFCLSSLDIPVRQVALEHLLSALQKLLERGVSQFKFVDRTFNLNLRTSTAILEFLLQRYEPGKFYHFEMVPDRLPEALRELIARFPKGALQFEVGIQTFNPEVAGRIQRRQDYVKLEDNLRFLRQQTGVHLHADLIAGLPGEDLPSFAAGFDRLVALGPQEIQLGILKRLRGTPISRHTDEWGMIYSPTAPYEILENRLISFEQMQRVRRFARFWDLVVNSGNFLRSAPMLWNGPESVKSPFDSFMAFSDWLYAETGRTDSIALSGLVELLFEYLTKLCGHDPASAAAAIWQDYSSSGRSDLPVCLRPYLSGARESRRQASRTLLPKRQARHST